MFIIPLFYYRIVFLCWGSYTMCSLCSWNECSLLEILSVVEQRFLDTHAGMINIYISQQKSTPAVRSKDLSKLIFASCVRYSDCAYIYFLFYQDFFSSWPQYGILGLEFLRQIASFERRLRGEAPTPLSLPYPFGTST